MSSTVTQAIVSIPRYGVYIWVLREEISRTVGLEVQNVATQPSLSSLANVNQHVISSPPPEVVAFDVTQEEDISSASDDKVCKSRKHLIESEYVGLTRVS